MTGAHRARVLIAEDDEAARATLSEAFRSRGWTTVASATGAAAGTLLDSESYDVVLIGGDPCETLRRIRRVHPDCRVLAVAPECARSTVLCAIRERAFSVFHKPLQTRAVVDMAELALASPAWEHDIELLSATPQWVSFSVRAEMTCADRVLQFLRELDCDLAEEERDRIGVALRELLINAIEHGSGGDPAKRIRVSSIRTSRAAVYHVEDAGSGFSFDALNHAAVSNPPEEPVRHVEIRAENGVRPGGFGILMARKMADELIYSEIGNEVLLIKYLNDGRESRG